MENAISLYTKQIHSVLNYTHYTQFYIYNKYYFNIYNSTKIELSVRF